MPNVNLSRYNSDWLISRRCFANPLIHAELADSKTPPPSQHICHEREGKPGTHLLTSKGMMLARLTGGSADKSYKQRETTQLSLQ